MKFGYVALSSLIILLQSTGAQGTVINHSTIGTGGFDLQGYEWLTFDQTVGLSRDQVLDSSLVTNDGFRYASREETETLIGSFWGGTHSGSHSNNYAGATAFLDVFGDTFPVNNTRRVTNGRTSKFVFGNTRECSTQAEDTCIGTIIMLQALHMQRTRSLDYWSWYGNHFLGLLGTSTNIMGWMQG